MEFGPHPKSQDRAKNEKIAIVTISLNQSSHVIHKFVENKFHQGTFVPGKKGKPTAT